MKHGEHRVPAGLLCIAVVLSLVQGSAGCSDKESNPCDKRPYSAPTLIGDLYRYCFGGVDREGESVSALLYLDTINLPSDNGRLLKLVLSSRPTDPSSGTDRLEFYFDDSLSSAVDPALLRQTGWKVAISGARIRYCRGCITNGGLAPIVFLEGQVSRAQFLHDPADTLAIFISHAENTGAQLERGE